MARKAFFGSEAEATATVDEKIRQHVESLPEDQQEDAERGLSYAFQEYIKYLDQQPGADIKYISGDDLFQGVLDWAEDLQRELSAEQAQEDEFQESLNAEDDDGFGARLDL